MKPGRDSVERIRRHEVSRALKKVNLSPGEEEVIERLSRSLVGKLLDGPISEVMARAEAEILFASRPDAEALCGLEGHGSGAESSGPKTQDSLRRNGTRYIEIGKVWVSNKPARSDRETGGTDARSISA
jgi:hypothetical protein